MTLQEPPEELRELPPTAKLVYKVIEYHEEAEDRKLTQAEIISQTALSSRSARYALNRLADKDLIDERPSTKDARQSLYWLVK